MGQGNTNDSLDISENFGEGALDRQLTRLHPLRERSAHSLERSTFERERRYDSARVAACDRHATCPSDPLFCDAFAVAGEAEDGKGLPAALPTPRLRWCTATYRHHSFDDAPSAGATR